MTTPSTNQIPATWTATEGIYEHASRTAIVTQQGKRWIGVIDGSTVSGDSGGTRFFGTAEAAIAAVDLLIPQDAREAAEAIVAAREPLAELEIPVEAPKRERKTRPFAIVERQPEEDGAAAAAVEPAAKKERKVRQPKRQAGAHFSAILAEDEDLDAVLAQAGWSREGAESGRLAGPQGQLEVTGARGSWIARDSSGSVLTGPTGGKRLFKLPSRALAALLKIAA